MEILESLKTLVEDTVLSKMENEQNPCVDGGSGLVSGDKVVVGSDEVVYGGIENVEVGNQGLGVGGIAGGGQGGGLSGGVGGVGGDFWGFGEMEKGVLGNEGKECGLGPDFGAAVGYRFENGSGFELVQDVCLSDIGIEEVGAGMLVMQQAEIAEVGAEKVVVQEGIQEVGVEKVVVLENIQEVGAEKVVVQEGIQEVGAEKVVMQENIQEVGAEKVVMQEGIEEVGAEKVAMQENIQEVGADMIVMQEGIQEVGVEQVVMQEGIQEVGAEKVLMQEGIEEVGDEDVVMREGIVEIETGDVVMQEAIEVEEVGTEKVVMQEEFKVVGTDKMVMQEDAVGDEKVLMQEGNEEVKAVMQKADEEVGAAKVVMQDGVKEQYISQQNLADYDNKIDVSKSGISLYVDVFGQVDSSVEGDHPCMVEQGSLERSALLPNSETKDSIAEVQDCGIYKNAEEGNDVEGEAIPCNWHSFCVGDLVWVKTNIQLWWPGIICEHCELSNDTLKGEDDRFQVRLFGSGNVSWGRTSQLKPFHEYFEELSRQSSSKSFFCAVEKAVGEIGRRVKLEMTCRCYLEESNYTDVAQGGGNISKGRASELDELPVLQFEPEKLLARVKCFARDVTLPGKIESKVIQNRLSAFYRSTGHLQLPIDLLQPTDAKSDDQNLVTAEAIPSKQALKRRTRSSRMDPEDGKNEAISTVVSSEMKTPSPILSTELPGSKANSVEHDWTNGKLEKSYESRERRKSKYLSFPYVDPGQVSKSLHNEEGNEMADPSDDSSRSARTVKSRDKKTKKNPCRKSTGHEITVPEVINASSAELLSKLRFTALDCLYPDESKQFDVMHCFVSTFRRFAFRDFTHEVTKEEDAVCMDFEDEKGLFKSVSEIAVNKTAGIGLLQKDTKIKSMPKSKKKENTSPLGLTTKPTDGCPGNITTSGSIVIDFQTHPNASVSQTVPMKRTKKAKKTRGFPEIKVMARLSDLKGSNVGAQLTSGNYPTTNGAVLPGENGTIETVGAGLKEVEVLGPYSLQNIPGLNMEGTKEPDSSKNTGPSSVTKGIQQTCMLSPDVPELKKRKRKQKAASVTSAIPDLNGNTSESYLSEMKPEVKPQRKSRKKKTGAGLLDINLDSGEAQTNGEALGTALLLKFAPDAPMPTPEDLASAFCIFGPLKDSEAKVFNDSGTAQVVFINSSDARTAFCSLEKNSPFGAALVNYRLQVLFAASGFLGPDGGLNMHQVWPAEKVKSPRKPRVAKKPKNLDKPSTISDPQGKSTEAPDLQFVRQNLQMMTSMLENAGDNISPEMRLKLETEIKSLLNRVTSMVGSSSS
ncbi:hypothetical protein POM88_029424 [Heracleum sosnowskyi]|uniref:PWWP domain-containing protein n=1 Tax=Heracleum sosnowskyi TaxID=360622 RepID=A0AAD8MH78_9APIA|nr:hypothetical protein POM88_029424 [Heracleum sosnowskyi]